MTGPEGTEVVLHGGTTNRGRVVRVGATVRRPRRATSAATEHLLQHLAAVGFDGAPRFLGVDRKGREVLSYVPGVAATPPYPAWALSDEALASVGRLLRRFHEAVVGYDPGSQAWPRAVPDAHRTALVSHNDPALDNVVFRDGVAVALIDFDLAGPGSRLWDLAAAARLWVPLRRDADIDDARGGRLPGRLTRLLEAYGLGTGDRVGLLDAVMAHHDWSYAIVDAAVRRGHAGFADYLDGGVAARAARTRQWYEEGADGLLG